MNSAEPQQFVLFSGRFGQYIPHTLPTLHTDVKNPNPVFAELAAIPITSLIKRIEDAERNRKESEEALSREQERSKELEIRWKALCSKKEKVRLSAALLCLPG